VLVGVDLEDPVAAAGVEAGVASVALDLPGAFNETRAVALCNCSRTVRRAVEQDNDFVGEAKAGKACAEPRFLVAGDNQR
jgi:hypothetical protein